MENFRIHSNIGKEQRINFELSQNFDHLELLSLKLTQKDVYTSLCSDYGVVCGRIFVNNGFGVPNARISIFIPQDDDDENDPVISALYPYKTITNASDDGYRYNLLPARKQHGGHEPVGTFPDQLDILTREEILEVYEKYYKYTVKTNDAGDFMIWGVPIGEQIIHIDLDLSDMGCFSLRPDDFIRKGFGVDDFKSLYEFKSSSDIDSLPQIKTFDKTIEVYPFWGGEDLCEIGITRVDFDLSAVGVVVEPKAYIIGGSFTDTDKAAINKNCMPSKNMGSKCTLTTQSGKIEAIRFSTYYDENNRPYLEEYKINDEINDDGAFMFAIPMNRDYIYTNEFGEHDYTNNPNKGIPTSACYRFRFTLSDAGLEKKRMRASYLVPNIREFRTTDDDENIDKSYAWSTAYSGYHESAISLILNADNGFYYPQDCFYRFQYGKVYTVSSFQNTLFRSDKRMLGIKEVMPTEEKDCSDNIVTPPVNIGHKNRGLNFSILLSTILTFLQYVYSLVSLVVFEFVATALKNLSSIFYAIKIFGVYFFGKIAERLKSAAYEVQSAGQMTLPLTIYDECEPCSTDEESLSRGFDYDNFCKVTELEFLISSDKNGVNRKIQFYKKAIRESTDLGTSWFDDGAARDCEEFPMCSGSTGFSFDNDWVIMNTEKVQDPSGALLPRFYIVIGGGDSFSGFTYGSFFIGEPEQDYEIYPLIEETGEEAGIYFEFGLDDFDELFGIRIRDTEEENEGEIDFKIYENQIIYGYIVDRKYPKSDDSYQGIETYTGDTIEEGCEMYDTLYNESIIRKYVWISGITTIYGDSTYPRITRELKGPYDDNIDKLPAFWERHKNNPPDINPELWSICSSVWYRNSQERLPGFVDWKRIPDRTYTRKTKTGYSEFRDGVFYIVPSSDGQCKENRKALKEWYRRQLVGLNFCGGIVNYGFIDNWLSGSLYFFQFKAKIKDKKNGQKIKVCKDIVRYVSDHERFYYRSCPYDYLDPEQGWGDAGKKILHPTTVVDLGPRDEFLKEICFDPSVDPNCSVSRSIGPTSFKSFGELVAFAINYRMDTNNADMKIDEFFDNGGFKDAFKGLYGKDTGKFFDGDIIQLISINSEAGIEGFDLQNAKYIGYNIGSLDPDTYPSVFTGGTRIYGPVPITLKYEDDGIRIRQCLNAPGYLTEASQKVPFYLWDKRGTGFGAYDKTKMDDQSWLYDKIEVDYLQGLNGDTYGYKFENIVNGINYDAYLLPPISYDFDGIIISGDTQLPEKFDMIEERADGHVDSYYLDRYADEHHGFTLLIMPEGTTGTTIDPVEGILYIRLGNKGEWSDPINWNANIDYSIWQTKDPYSGEKQVLSTPFLFYFGLRPGKTGLDKLIKVFGPMGAFPSAE